MDQIIQVFFNGAVLERAWPYLVRGVGMTALLSLVIVPIGIFSGLTVAMLYHLHREVVELVHAARTSTSFAPFRRSC